MSLENTSNEDVSFASTYAKKTRAPQRSNDGGVAQTSDGSGDVFQSAGTAMGNLEFSKYLYETGLQNVFNDYEKNVAMLSQDKQQSLQDAYFVKEMSKKYLGEYASNVGIGDVSGNLLDIYSKYQENQSAINENYDALKLNLDKEYQQQKATALSNIMQTEYNIQAQQLNENAQDVLYAIQTGKTDGMSDMEYLEAHKSEMTDDAYRAIYGSIYSLGYTTIASNIQNGTYGYQKDASGNYVLDEKGNKVPYTNAREYLESVKDQLNQKDYQTIVDMLDGAEAGGQNTGIEIIDYRSATLQNGEPNLNRQATFDPTYYFNVEDDFNSNSDVYSFAGQEHVRIEHDVDNDESAPVVVSNAELMEAWNEAPENEGQVLKEGDIYYYKDTGLYYIRKGSYWYRLVSQSGSLGISQYAESNMDKWVIADGVQNSDGSFQANGKDKDTLTVNGITYVEGDKKTGFSPSSSTLTDDQKALVALFKQKHPSANGGIKPHSVVYYNGRFWECRDDGIIVTMNKKD